MQKYAKVRSTAEKVLPLELDEYHVTVNNGISEIHEPAKEDDPSSGFNGWEIEEQIIYDKDEYIVILSEKNAGLEQEATDLQIALVDVYEMAMGLDA